MSDDGKDKRSGSESRQRRKRWTIRFSDDENAIIEKLVEATRQSPGALLRAALLNVPLPRHRRPTVNDKALGAFLAAAAKVKDALKDSLAELGKSGSNLNQIAYMLNANTAPARIMNIIENAINEHNALVARHEAASKDLDELRTMAMDALGLER
jgi:predicted transcriptional regulator